MYSFNTSLAANVPTMYKGNLNYPNALKFDTPMASEYSQGTPSHQQTLLTKLQNIQTLTSDIDTDHPAPEKSIQTQTSHVASQSSSRLKYIDDTDAGNLTSAFINVLSGYKTMMGAASNTLEFYEVQPKELQQIYATSDVSKSLFNPYYGVKAKGHHTNLPLVDTIDRGKNSDISDCSIWKLLQLSASTADVGDLGQQYYRLADFMFCKDLGKVSNNHLITLRRFASPVGDNIYGVTNLDSEGFGNMPDIGHLVTWFGTEDNKLSDIIKMQYRATWKEMNAEIQQVNSQEDDPGRGIIGMVNNSLNPNYNALQGAGQTGTQNLIAKLGSKISIGGVNFGGAGQNNQNTALTNYDTHKIYEPKNTIRSNHYYEGKIEFEQEFTLNFSYELRSYGDINSKSAMLDLISNITRVTFTKGKFWGGSVKWIGPPQNDSAFRKANAFIDEKFEKLEGFMTNTLNGQISWGEIMASFADSISNLVNYAKDKVGEIAEGVKDGSYAREMSEFLKSHDTMSAVKGQLKNALGRPAMYAINSFVRGDNLGLWHVTIGNPRNPIMCIGNLIVTNAEISVGDVPLGLDDFPTEIKVSVTLKHCKPRDMVDIQRMFAKGESAIYVGLGQSGHSKFYKDETAQITSKDNYEEKSYHQIFGSSSAGKRVSNNFSELA